MQYHRSQKSKPMYLPRFPRIQLMLKRRLEDDELEEATHDDEVEPMPRVLH